MVIERGILAKLKDVIRWIEVVFVCLICLLLVRDDDKELI